jgi:hypothetical protein
MRDAGRSKRGKGPGCTVRVTQLDLHLLAFVASLFLTQPSPEGRAHPTPTPPLLPTGDGAAVGPLPGGRPARGARHRLRQHDGHRRAVQGEAVRRRQRRRRLGRGVCFSGNIARGKLLRRRTAPGRCNGMRARHMDKPRRSRQGDARVQRPGEGERTQLCGVNCLELAWVLSFNRSSGCAPLWAFARRVVSSSSPTPSVTRSNWTERAFEGHRATHVSTLEESAQSRHYT